MSFISSFINIISIDLVTYLIGLAHIFQEFINFFILVLYHLFITQLKISYLIYCLIESQNFEAGRLIPCWSTYKLLQVSKT